MLVANVSGWWWLVMLNTGEPLMMEYSGEFWWINMVEYSGLIISRNSISNHWNTISNHYDWIYPRVSVDVTNWKDPPSSLGKLTSFRLGHSIMLDYQKVYLLVISQLALENGFKWSVLLNNDITYVNGLIWMFFFLNQKHVETKQKKFYGCPVTLKCSFDIY